MLRRSHKKSRGGCLTCKARHAKCDERRPICTICKISHRACTYDTQQSQTYPRLESSDVQNDGSPSVAEKDTFEDIPSININHMELLFHLTETKNLPCLSLADDAFTNPSLISLGIKLGFMFPFLLHEFLAFSALHLACTGRENNQFQFHQAMALQTRAVSLFNSSFADVNESNCVPILLFSSVLGQHFLTNTLAERHPGGLDAFLSKYIHCVEIHRGIHVIAMQYWPQLMESELAPILAASSQFTSRTPKGNTCRKISELITGSQALSVDEKEACNSVIQHLQVGFDAVLEGEEKSGYNHYMIYTWLMLAPPKFIDMLSEKRPEVLVLLAYYALLLHYGRHMWQVKDAGIFLLGIIRDYLHPTWHSWLVYPQSQVSEDP